MQLRRENSSSSLLNFMEENSIEDLHLHDFQQQNSEISDKLKSIFLICTIKLAYLARMRTLPFFKNSTRKSTLWPYFFAGFYCVSELERADKQSPKKWCKKSVRKLSYKLNCIGKTAKIEWRENHLWDDNPDCHNSKIYDQDVSPWSIRWKIATIKINDWKDW